MRISRAIFHLALTISAVTVLTFGATVIVKADDNTQDRLKQAADNGTITGRIVLPAKVPEGFRGGELSLKDAVLVIEGMYRGPRMERPDNYGKMSREERKAWFTEFKKTQPYQEYCLLYTSPSPRDS